MSLKPPPAPRSHNTLSVKLGRWFEARGTGAGVIVIPILLALLMAGWALSRVLGP